MRAFARRPARGLLAAAMIAVAATAEAQYFGRNKVQYRTFDFEVLETDHFDIYFHDGEREAAAEVGRLAERWYARLSALLNHTFETRQPVVLYATHAEFQQTNVVSGEIGEGTAGVTEGLKRRVVLPLGATLADTDHVLGHELVHAFQYDITRREANRSSGATMDRLPLWFVEGLAEYLSIGPVDPQTAMWVRDALRHDALPDVRRLSDPRLFPYRWGHALWAYIGGRFGDAVVPDLFAAALTLGPEEAFESVLGVPARTISADWHEAIRAQYGPVLERTGRPFSYGRAWSGSERAGADRPLYASPALSPDGRQIAFFSERDLLSVDLYVGDVETGRIVQRLSRTAVDPHFSSLQFISSAGAWRPDGRALVVGALRAGSPVLAILDTTTGRTEREVPFPALGQIVHPSWSPEGRRIAFAASSAGQSDIYVYDLERQALRPLTADRAADLQPAWSPDGRRVAFVTDRFTTDLTRLAAGAYGLALVDVDTGTIERLRTFDNGNAVNPQWSGDGRTLYFISDRAGTANLYAMDLATRAIRQLTALDTGVSGITPLSPALTVAREGRRIAFTVHDRGRPAIHVVDDAGRLASVEPDRDMSSETAALPPLERASTTLTTALADATTGLPDAPGTVRPYRPRLTLDWVGQPYATAGYSRFGPMFGGGLSFLWSDMLGDHTLAATVDANTYGSRLGDLWKNTGGMLGYFNLARRWDWGVSVEQSPYLAGGVVSGVATQAGQRVLVEQEILERQTFRAVNGLVSRPFSQAHRLEFGASYQHLSFEQDVRTIVSSLQTGRVLADTRETSALARPLDLGNATAALVYDTAVFGATSPVAGARSRLQVGPTWGSLNVITALADYRRYVMPARFYTVAARVLHYGRYGSGAEDPRFVPLFIGYPQLVRGYGLGSFSAGECSASASGRCPEFERLIGSRMLVTNIELRFPLLRPFGFSGRMYGPIPTEVALFADGGAAWTRGERPTWLGGSRSGVASAGFSVRVNLFGFAVGQVDLARPFQRPGRGWLWAFSLTPGF